MRFEKSTQIEEDFYSELLEQDVAVKGSVTVKGYHNRATYNDPEDWDFNITDQNIELYTGKQKGVRYDWRSTSTRPASRPVWVENIDGREQICESVYIKASQFTQGR